MRRLTTGACAVTLVAAFVGIGPADAQYGWDTFDVGLTAEDIERAQSAARDQLDGQPVGTVVEWDNPASGASGTVELVRLYQRDGLSCREVKHRFHTRSEGNNEFVSRICLTADGWKFDE